MLALAIMRVLALVMGASFALLANGASLAVKGDGEREKEISNSNSTRREQTISFDHRHPIPIHITLEVPSWVDDWVAPEEFRNWFPYYLTGHDHEGSPVYVLEYGNFKFNEAFTKWKGGVEEARDVITQYLEQGVYRLFRDGQANNVQEIGCILDFNGFSLATYASPLAIEMGLKQFSFLNRLNNVLKYALLINANFAADNFLRIAKPFIGNILDKCEIYGTRKEKWLPFVARRIPTSQLAPWYGGDQSWKPLVLGGAPLNSTKKN